MGNEFNPKIYFGSVPEAMYSLLNLVLIAEFSQFGRPIFLKQPWFFPVFLLVIVIAIFGLLNMLIGLIVEKTGKLADKLRKERSRARDMSRAQKMIKLVELLDRDKSGFINIPELTRSVTDAKDPNTEAHDLMKDLNFPVGFDAGELLVLLGGGDGKIEDGTFQKNAIRIITASSDRFEWHCLLLFHLQTVLHKVHDLGKVVREM